MCGIIGYVGSREAKPLLLQGLKRLEYRGYDSAGIALREEDNLDYVRAVGNLQNLVEAAGPNGSVSNHGPRPHALGDARAVTEQNAHPLTGCPDGKVAIVLNGIVENYRELRASLQKEGHRFHSETDAEVVTQSRRAALLGDLLEAVRAAYADLEGHFAFVVIHHDHPDLLVGARHQCPLVVGVGEGEMFFASATTAFLPHTRRIQLVEDGEVVAITPSGARFFTQDGPVEHKEIEPVEWNDEEAEKGGYETFMLKEIYEQPDAVRETIGDRIRPGAQLELEGLGLSEKQIRNLRRIVVLACGTAYHAGVVGRYIIEEWARLPVEPDIASEWIYRNPVLSKDTLVIGISQSGETRDTVAAMRLAKQAGAHTVAITNQMGSQITREVDSVLYTRCGLEVGVAASKTFTAQVSLLILVALKLAQVRRTLSEEDHGFILDAVYNLPEKIAQFLDGDHPIEDIAQRYYEKPFFLYLGRHIGLPVALEGALKLKEISYIPTEAYSAGEMKHGPIALLDEDTPVVVVATTDPRLRQDRLEHPGDARARRARDRDRDRRQRGHPAPRRRRDLRAEDAGVPPGVLAVVPLQLLAYRIARLRGLNVDQPRNLAKTVTVE
jgi:glucosamine--fructose-6-phosphate aminotransferase (isomerizing)